MLRFIMQIINEADALQIEKSIEKKTNLKNGTKLIESVMLKELS